MTFFENSMDNLEIKEVMIVDDHCLVIDGVVSLLKSNFNIGSVSSLTNPDDAVQCVKRQKFDLYILDLGFRTESNVDMRQLEYVREINALHKDARIIVHTMREDYAMVSLLKKMSGVKGIVLKGPERKYLINAVEVVMNGGEYLCPRFKSIYQRSESYRKRLINKRIAIGIPTPKELKIIKLIAAGYTSEEIGNQLGNSKNTIESDRKNINFKLGVSSPSQLIVTALLLNYITLEDVALDMLNR